MSLRETRTNSRGLRFPNLPDSHGDGNGELVITDSNLCDSLTTSFPMWVVRVSSQKNTIGGFVQRTVHVFVFVGLAGNPSHRQWSEWAMPNLFQFPGKRTAVGWSETDGLGSVPNRSCLASVLANQHDAGSDSSHPEHVVVLVQGESRSVWEVSSAVGWVCHAASV